MIRADTEGGYMDIDIKSIERKGEKLFVTGQVGIWNAKMYVSVEEVGRLIKLALTPSVIFYLLFFPFLYFKSKLRRGSAPSVSDNEEIEK